jgi:hypothetical protein
MTFGSLSGLWTEFVFVVAANDGTVRRVMNARAMVVLRMVFLLVVRDAF